MSKKKKRILIVDDNHSIHEDLIQILSSEHSDIKDKETIALENELFDNSSFPLDTSSEHMDCYEIDSAYQGDDAIKMVEKAEAQGNPYALIFMDVRMPPGIDGIQTIHKIWEKHPSIEMVICTAYSDYSWDMIVKTLGSTDQLFFMKKPFDITTVKQTALSLTNKWDLARKSKAYVNILESDVRKRTAQLTNLQSYLKKMKERAEALTLSKRNFLSTLNYEVNTPLNGIMGITDLLLDTNLNDEQRDLARTIKTSGDFLILIINDLLDYSKLETGNIALNEIEFNLRATVGNVVDLISVVAFEKGLEVVTLINSDVPETLVGDPMRVRQILLNFANNATRLTNRGEIVISVSLEPDHPLTNDAQERNRKVRLRFEVMDTGVGLTPEQIELYLSSDSLSECAIENRSDGPNFSMAICRHLTELMSGSLGAKSEQGKGSTFWYTAEFEKVKSPEYQFPDLSQNITGMRCLVICDSTTNSRVFSLYINHWGGKCNEASTIENGIDQLYTALDTLPFDIIIVDFKQGDINRYVQAANEIRQHEPIRNIPLICLASKVKRGDANILKDAGYHAFLAKPIRQGHLFNCLLMIKDIIQKNIDFDHTGIITKHLLDEILSDNYRVLVVEDNFVNQKLLVCLLNKLGVRCDVAVNGKTAVEAFLNNRYDMILMDCHMPIMDGYNATRSIRQYEGDTDKHIPILAITADDKENSREACIHAGMQGFINKPFNIDEIAATLKKYLTR